MNRTLRAVVLIVSCLVAVDLFCTSQIFVEMLSGNLSKPLAAFRMFLLHCLGPNLAFKWINLSLEYLILGVAIPLALVGLGFFVWFGRPKAVAGRS